MGFWKNKQIEAIEKGYSCDIDKYVCFNCVGNYGLKQSIREKATENHCDYCGISGSDPIAVSLEKLIDLIMDGVCFEWDEAVNFVPWDGREGGYQWPVTDLEDIIYWHYGSEVDINNGELWEDIRSCLGDADWAETDFEHREITTWEQFCYQVKYETRFVFYMAGVPPYHFGPKPFTILETTGRFIESCGLIIKLDQGSTVYRARTCDNSTGHTTVDAIGPPPKEKASAGRMNPTGIPMFYGAFDETTTIEETKNHDPYISIGTFETLNDLNLINLVDLPKIPSVFDRDKQHMIYPLQFLHHFVEDITKPVLRSEGMVEHIDYVPSQIVTEFFRYIFKTSDGKDIHGIIYPSSRNFGGKCCVLFFDVKECKGDNSDHEKKIVLIDYKTITL